MIGVLAAVALVLAGAGCGSGGAKSPRPVSGSHAGKRTHRLGAGKPPFVLGTKNFTEEFILGQLYLQALRAQGFTVTLKNDLGPTEVVDRKLTSHEIDGYPEYTGTILSVFGHDAESPSSPVQAYQRAAAVERSHGASLLAMASAADTDVIVTEPGYASRHHLHSLADLAKLGATATLAGPPEFKDRSNGMIGLSEKYGIRRLRFRPVTIGQQYEALSSGRAQLAVGFTTDGELTRGGLVTLSDPKGIFGNQNVTFVVRNDVLAREGPGFAQTVNAVSAHLSTEALRLMNAAVSLDQQAPAAVARQFLGANGLG